jgi:hypothetical protein
MEHTRPIAATILFGTISIVLYIALLTYSDLLVDLAYRTRSGDKTLFFVPIIIAFVFSFVHGNFTGNFWESMGLRAAKTLTNQNK